MSEQMTGMQKMSALKWIGTVLAVCGATVTMFSLYASTQKAGVDSNDPAIMDIHTKIDRLDRKIQNQNDRLNDRLDKIMHEIIKGAK